MENVYEMVSLSAGSHSRIFPENSITVQDVETSSNVQGSKGQTSIKRNRPVQSCSGMVISRSACKLGKKVLTHGLSRMPTQKNQSTPVTTLSARDNV
jgi:hypothetical protein